MKLYSLPDSVPAPEVDYRNYDNQKVAADEKQHMADLKTHLIKLGYIGKHTGEIYSEYVADGTALYMVVDAPRAFGLIHLPYGDAYQSRNVAFLTKAEILRRIVANKRFEAMFNKTA